MKIKKNKIKLAKHKKVIIVIVKGAIKRSGELPPLR